MADDKKTEKKSEKKSEESKEVARGDRGELGVATAGLTIRQMLHAAHFSRKDVGDKHNPRKRVWVPNPGQKVSLKKFARELLKSGNQVAKDWFAHKRGSLNAQRSEKNQSRVSLEKQATKAAKRKKSQGKGGKATDAAAATAVVTKGKK